MATSAIASFLSSPTIRLILPPVKAECGAEDKTYIVHRSLLSTHTSLLQSRRTRDSYVLLDPHTVDVPTVERALEYLYTGDYNAPIQPTPPEETDDLPLLQSTRPAAHLPQNSPLLAAAMAGAIGIWGKPAPRFDEAENTSTYTSIYFPAEERPKNMTVVTNTFSGGFGKDRPTTNGFLPSPPASPVFQTYAPILSLKSSPKPTETTVLTVPHHLVVLRAHIAVYRFASIQSVNIPGLSALALDKLTLQFESTRAADLSSLVIDFVTAVFRPCRGEEELQRFLVALVVSRIGELSQWAEFNEFVRKGGEFVVDVLGSMAVTKA